jgi:hypothetical protein
MNLVYIKEKNAEVYAEEHPEHDAVKYITNYRTVHHVIEGPVWRM